MFINTANLAVYDPCSLFYPGTMLESHRQVTVAHRRVIVGPRRNVTVRRGRGQANQLHTSLPRTLPYGIDVAE